MLNKLKAIYKLLFCKEYILYIKVTQNSVFTICKSDVNFHQQVAKDLIDTAKTSIEQEKAVKITQQIINNYN